MSETAEINHLKKIIGELQQVRMSNPPEIRYRTAEETQAARQQAPQPIVTPLKMLLHILGNAESVASLQGQAEVAGQAWHLPHAAALEFIHRTLSEAGFRVPPFNPDPSAALLAYQMVGFRMMPATAESPQAGDLILCAEDGQLLLAGFVQKPILNGSDYTGEFKAIGPFSSDGTKDGYADRWTQKLTRAVAWLRPFCPQCQPGQVGQPGMVPPGR